MKPVNYMFEICKGLMKQIPHEQLNDLFIDELKKRKTKSITYVFTIS